MDEEREHEQGHRHEGTFAEGQEGEEHHPEAGTHGDFAEGQEEDTPDHEHAHRGGFAEGQDRGRHPEDESQPDYGRGQDSN
jgi:hypothetical protein